MSQLTLSKRYARALMELALDNQKAAEYFESLKVFRDLLTTEKSLALALESPFFDVQARLRVVESVVTQLGFETRVKNFIKVLTQKGRMHLFNEIVSAYQSMYFAHQGIINAVVTTAKDMPASFYEKLEVTFGKITGKKVVCRAQVNPRVLGGVAVELDGKVYDGTVLSDLNRLESRLRNLATL